MKKVSRGVSELTPTEEQALIIKEAVTGNDNIIISALAGASKTTTLEMIASALSSVPILSIAFNKRISDEMKERLPSNVKAQTINSLGHGVWASQVGKKLNLDLKKSYNVLQQLISSLPKGAQGRAWEGFADTLRIVRLAKQQGYIPPGSFAAVNSLFSPRDFFDALDEEISAADEKLVNDALVESINQGYKGVVDFDDQVYLSTLFAGTFPRFPLVLVDEAQDLSALQHKMLEKLVAKRVIAVGDHFQSIYAFRGAASDSMSRLQSRFSMKELTLSVSFRCPIEIVKLARFRAPSMQWAPTAQQGHVETLGSWSAKDIPDGSAILCRNNSPLFSCALKLLASGRGVKLIGTDLGPSIVKTLKKLGDGSLPKEGVLAAIDAWAMERLAKSRSEELTLDKAACLKVFANYGETLSAAIAYAEHLFTSSGPVQLLTVHKAKGLEWPTIYLLDAWRMPSKYANSKEELEQEENLRYVSYTRAKENLYFIDMEGFAA